jgi:hypothetical protein
MAGSSGTCDDYWRSIAETQTGRGLDVQFLDKQGPQATRHSHNRIG